MKILYDIVDSEMTAQQAIIFYGNQHRSYATAHDIDHNKNKMSLLPGTPLNNDILSQLTGNLAKTQSQLNGFIDRRLVYYSAPDELLITCCPSASRPLFFKCASESDKALNDHSGTERFHPNLLFVVKKNKLRVYAYEEDHKMLFSGSEAHQNTQLYYAPYFNIYDDHTVCLGSSQVTSSPAPKDLDNIESAFFDSHFSHSNRKKVKTVNCEGMSLRDFWLDCFNSGMARTFFPDYVLVPLNKTIKDLVNEA